MNTVRLILLSFAALALSSCQLWREIRHERLKDAEGEYRSSQQAPELRLPPGVTANFRDPYRIPDHAAGQVGVSSEPPTLLLATGSGIEQDKTIVSSWPSAWVELNTTELWQDVHSFLQKREVTLLSEDVKAGRLDTDWVQTDDSSILRGLFGSDAPDYMRDKFRIQVKPGRNPRESHIQIEQLSSEYVAANRNVFDNLARLLEKSNDIFQNVKVEINKKPLKWQTRSLNQDVATKFLNDYLLDLSQRQYVAKAQARHNDLEVIRFELGKNTSGIMAYTTSASFQQVWEQTPAIMEALGFKITDRDQSLGRLFVTYEGAPNQGVWKRLAFWRKRGNAPALPLEATDYQWQLGLIESNATSLTLLNKDGKPLPEKTIESMYPIIQSMYEKKESP